jgi:hypothetical protein
MSGIEVLSRYLCSSDSPIDMSDKNFKYQNKKMESKSVLVVNKDEDDVITNKSVLRQKSSYTIDDILRKRQTDKETSQNQVIFYEFFDNLKMIFSLTFTSWS